MKNKRLLVPLILVFISALAVVFSFYGKILMQPNAYLMLDKTDGLKNYFTFAYYLKHDIGWQFSGFHYPYGEYIVYTDNHPIAALFFNFIDNNIYPIADYSVALLNVWMLGSMAIGAIFIYLVLAKLGVGRWFAIPMALLITFLSPQIDRTFAHYALSYIYFIPMMLYGLLRFNEGKKRWFWGSFLFVLLFVAGFTHTYFILIGVVFFLAYALVYAISTFFRKQGFSKPVRAKRLKYLGGILLFSLSSLIIMQIIIGFTNPYDSRIEIPYGFFTYKSFFEQTFFPIYPPFRQAFIYIFKAKNAVYGEAIASVGVIGFVMLLLIGVRILHFFAKKQFIRLFKITTNYQLNLILWAATLVLLFSFAYPFTWGLEWILDYIPQLRQFRSLARFTWMFYYVFLIYAAYYWYLVYRRLSFKKLKGVGLSIVGFVLLIWAVEAHVNLWYVSGKSQGRHSPHANKFLQQKPIHIDSLEKSVNLEDYQAAIVTPYFHVGSEKFSILRDARSLQWGMSFAYHTGMPMLNMFASRSSIEHTLKNVQLFSSSLVEKEILKDFNDKPILLCQFKPGKITPDEQNIMDNGELVFETKEWAYYKLTKDSFKPNFETIKAQYQIQKDSLLKETGFVLEKSFDETPAPVALRGEGAATTTEGELVFFDDYLPQDTTELEVSFWLYVDTRMSFPILSYERYDSTGAQTHKKEWNMWNEVEVYKNWIRVTRTINPNTTDRHRFRYFNADHITVDELLMKPVGKNVYKETEEGLLYNGYLME